jgi:Beta-glucosidase-related glycosidases
MIKKIILSCLCVGAIVPLLAQQAPQLGQAPIDKIVKAMTLEEKATLLIGTGMAGMTGGNAVVGETQNLVPGAAGTTNPIPRLGIPAIVLADGPAGLRIQPKRKGDPNTYYCTAFPVATLLASTWNTDVVERVGKAMGNEVLEYGADVLLAPALNIQRNPLCGRNFEYYSEDPLVAGKIAAAYVRGIQSNGVGTSIKHFAGNNQESNRMGDDARMTQRTLREIYLKGFEIAVKESNPWTVMTSYNKINGTYTSESRGLVTDILRNEWGFKGTVMTDWFGGKNTPAQVHAGNDLMMPGTPQQYKDIIEAVKNGSLSKADIDANVSRILTLIVNSPRFKKYAYSNKPDLQAHAAVTRESATEGMVLLKNAANTLPINKEVKKIAAYGITSYDFIAGGTGSGDVNRAYTISLTQGLSNAGYMLDEGVKTAYTEYIAAEKEKNKPDKSNPLANFLPKKRMAEMTPDEAALSAQVMANDVAIITLGRTSGEFFDRKIADDYLLSDAERKLLEEVCTAYHKVGKKVVVILNIGGAIETASWKELPDAILLAWQAGQEGGNSVADILSGKVNPSGKLAMTFPINYKDAASSANFPYDYTPDAKAVIGGLTGNIPAHDPVRNLDYTYYEEGIYVGYRYFDTFGKQVSYPFGYGLSYTHFDFTKASVKEEKDKYTFSVTVKNGGTMAGKEVAELYIAAPKSNDLDKPQKELKAFVKTKLLQPGEEQTVSMTLSLSDLASFNANINAWVADAGTYDIQIGTSSQDIKQHLSLTVATKTITEKTHNAMKLFEKMDVLMQH